MLYRALVRFLSLVARTFYKRIQVVGLENVPARGGVIFAGNQPNALVHGLLLIGQAGRTPVHVLGNVKLWKIPFGGSSPPRTSAPSRPFLGASYKLLVTHDGVWLCVGQEVSSRVCRDTRISRDNEMTERISQTILCIALILAASRGSAEENVCDGPPRAFDIPHIDADVVFFRRATR